MITKCNFSAQSIAYISAFSAFLFLGVFEVIDSVIQNSATGRNALL